MAVTGLAPAPVPSLRVSDAERDRVATFLRERCGEGRLDLDELGERLERVYGARTAPELAPLVADLPGGRSVLPGASPSRRPRRGSHMTRAAWTVVLVLLVAGLAHAAATAPLELGIAVALLAVIAVLLVELLLASLPTLVVGGVIWLVVRAVRRRPGLGLVPPP